MVIVLQIGCVLIWILSLGSHLLKLTDTLLKPKFLQSPRMQSFLQPKKRDLVLYYILTIGVLVYVMNYQFGKWLL